MQVASWPRIMCKLLPTRSRTRIFRKITLFLQGFFFSCIVFAGFEISQELLAKIESKYGKVATVRVSEWQQLMLANQALPENEKLAKVNDFFNQSINFVDDIALWNVNDYWATPVEFLAQGAGDCEDYAIAKYFTLKELGVPEEKMRITYVKAIQLNQAHMVLTYFETPRAVPVVLDNLIPEIKLASTRDDLVPVYSFNGSGLWLAKSRGSGQRVGDADRLSLWADLTQRIMRNDL